MSQIRLVFEPDGKLKVLGSPDPDDQGTYKIDPAQGHIDLTNQKKKPEVVQGIYKLDGDKLTICFPAGPNAGVRPKEFTAEKGTQQIMFVLEKLPPDIAGEPGDAGRRQGQNNLKQIGLAMHSYHDTYKHLPMHAIYSKDGKTPLLSWRVAILPYIEQNNLYMQFKLDEPWDSAHNKKLLEMMPKTYQMPNVEGGQPSTTRYLAFTGKGTVFEGTKGIRIQDITDGT